MSIGFVSVVIWNINIPSSNSSPYVTGQRVVQQKKHWRWSRRKGQRAFGGIHWEFWSFESRHEPSILKLCAIQQSDWSSKFTAGLKTSCDSILITWSFAKTFRHSFAKLFFSFARMNSTKTSFASFRGGLCHLMKELQAFITGPTLNTWDLVAVCEGRAWFRYLSFREAFAQLPPHFRGFRAISDAGGTTCWCANLKMHLHNITCNFISRHITLLSRAFAREHYYKLFRKSFAASILAFAEPSDINSLTTQYMSGFRRCSNSCILWMWFRKSNTVTQCWKVEATGSLWTNTQAAQTHNLSDHYQGSKQEFTCMALGNCLGSIGACCNVLGNFNCPLRTKYKSHPAFLFFFCKFPSWWAFRLIGLPTETFFGISTSNIANKRSLKRYFKIDEPCGRIGKDVTSLK